MSLIVRLKEVMKKDIPKTILVSLIVAAVSTPGLAIIFSKGPVVGTNQMIEGIDAFMHFIGTPIFQQRLFEAFTTEFGVILLSCIILLWVISKKNSA